ncbi:unnamed protein product [Rhizophagus irregularis]|nr:unnamed protein product [Rhizophagus irregularis]
MSNKVTSNGSHLVPIHGITQDPVTKEYMVVMLYFPSDSLKDNLPKIKSNPNDKLPVPEHEPKTTRLPEAHHDVSRKLSSSSVISSSSVLIVTGKIMTSDNYDDCNDCMVQDEEK